VTLHIALGKGYCTRIYLFQTWAFDYEFTQDTLTTSVFHQANDDARARLKPFAAAFRTVQDPYLVALMGHLTYVKGIILGLGVRLAYRQLDGRSFSTRDDGNITTEGMLFLDSSFTTTYSHCRTVPTYICPSHSIWTDKHIGSNKTRSTYRPCTHNLVSPFVYPLRNIHYE